MAQNRAEIAIDVRVGLESLKRTLIASGTLQKETFATDRLLDDAFRRARIIGSNQPVWRAHDDGMARVVNEHRERLTFERIEFNDDDFTIAGPVGIDAEKRLSVRSYGSAI